MRPLILFLILALAPAGISAGTPPNAPAKIPAVELCELTHNPKLYDGKIVRLRVAYFFDTTATDDPFYFFYHSACEGRERRIAPEFETMEKGARERAFKLIEKHTRKNSAGTAGRVEMTVVGRFNSSKGGYGHLGQHPFGFDVTSVERVRPIDPDAVWPD
ncbi:MAG TPA: hypothetical protein VJ715_12830 [Pyrinomonadaceae bacterium]|nr:hypothetical protein [Pyrinomonadaceae bacterium]